MDNPDITALTEIPKHTDDNAAARLRDLLAKHYQLNQGTKFVFASRVGELVIENVHHQLVACVGRTDRVLNTWLYSFTDKGMSIVSMGTSQIIAVYPNWKEGYKRLIHDIRDHWAQIEIDAKMMADPYKLLYSRLS